ncbi:PIG-L deacetylase family protein [Chloroflexota bacterium]
MELQKDSAQIFIPDGSPPEFALERTTHLAIAAHQDDIEIMAIDGILECFQSADRWFTGVVVTSGASSPRNNIYRDYTDEEMRVVRAKEQFKAAFVGEYAAQILLDYSSAALKDSSIKQPIEDIHSIIQATRPEIVYTHNLADKHPTHVAVAVRTVEALRSLPEDFHPKRLIGCEVWRDLGWMPDEDKVVFNSSSHENLQTSLVGVFDSQITGGKRYDLATMGRRRANATYFESHGVDRTTGLAFGMELTPLIEDPKLDINDYVQTYIERFGNEVRNLITTML